MFGFDDDQILSTVQQMRTLMQQQNVSAQEMASAVALLQAAKGATSGGPVLPAFTVPLPLSPKVLTEMVYAASVPGLAQKGVISSTVTVPAGGTVTLTVPVLPGTVTLFVAPLEVTATYYDYSILADVFLDQQNISPTPYEYALVGPDQIQSLMYAYITQYLRGVFTNGSATSTTITFKAEVLAMDRTLFEKQLWLPLVRQSFDVAKHLASVYANGGQG